MTVASNPPSPAEIRFSRIDDRAAVRSVAATIDRNLVQLRNTDGLPVKGVPLGVVRAWTGHQTSIGISLAAVAHLGHRIVGDPRGVSADHWLLVTPEPQIRHLDRMMLARASVRCPGAVQVHLVCRTGRQAEDPWMVRGCLERLWQNGDLVSSDSVGSVWRVATAAEREAAAVERYGSALARELSEYEAREYGWPE